MNDDELYYRIYELESRINRLESENEDLYQRIDQLRDAVLDAYDNTSNRGEKYALYSADWCMDVFSNSDMSYSRIKNGNFEIFEPQYKAKSAFFIYKKTPLFTKKLFETLCEYRMKVKGYNKF